MPGEALLIISYVEGTSHTISITSREYVSVKLPARFYDKPIYTITVSYNHYNDVYTMIAGNYEEAYTAYQKGWYVNMRLIGSYDSIIPCVSKDGPILIFSDSDHFDSSDVYMSQIRLDSNGNVSNIYTRVATTKYILDNFQKKLIGTESQYVSFDANGNAIAKDAENGMIFKDIQAIMPSLGKWTAIVYGNDKFVAVGDNTLVAGYSEDGITWNLTKRLSEASSWKGVAYGNGRFVAICTGNTKWAYSDDGITWTITKTTRNTTWSSIGYGNGKFVATIANSSRVTYSEDGITWIDTNLPTYSNWCSITYGNDKFVAVSKNSTDAVYSVDGISWTDAVLPSSASWNSVTYGNGKFVAVASNSNIAAYSVDGISWTETVLPSSIYWFAVTYGDDKFVAVAYDNKTVAFSYDGITWHDSIQYLSQNNSNITESVRSVIGIPSYTTANNGQFLRVIDGTPTWTEFLPTLTSPNGTKYQLTVADDGTLSAVAVS